MVSASAIVVRRNTISGIVVLVVVVLNVCVFICLMEVGFQKETSEKFLIVFFHFNTSVTGVVGMKLTPFANRDLSSSPNGRSSGIVTTSLSVLVGFVHDHLRLHQVHWLLLLTE